MAATSYQLRDAGRLIFFDKSLRSVENHILTDESEMLQKNVIIGGSEEITHIGPEGRQRDGSDSGLDVTTTLNTCFENTLSTDVDDCVNSTSLFDIDTNFNDSASCESSAISCISDIDADQKSLTNSSYRKYRKASVSIEIGCKNHIRKFDNVRKKVGLYETSVVNRPLTWEPDMPTFESAAQVNKLRSFAATAVSTRERARFRENAEKPLSNASSKTTTPPLRSTPIRSTPKPDNLPYSLNSSLNSNKVSQRSPSTTRSRTPGTPSEDGRWPSITHRTLGPALNTKRASSLTPDSGTFKLRGQIPFQSKCTSTNDNANTLPRRKKQKSVEDLKAQISRSSSISRDNPLISSTISAKKRNVNSAYCIPSRVYTPNKSGYRKTTSKTKIYHEIAVQTIVTRQDIEKVLNGDLCKCVRIDSVELAEKQTQSDFRDVEMECLREEIQMRRAKENELIKALEEKMNTILTMEKQITKEREEKMSIRKELNQNTEKVIGMLELSRCSSSFENNSDSLMVLESQIQLSGHELNEKHEEIVRLRKLCRTLQSEIQRSTAAYECLMQEKMSVEQEAMELQDFLQHEKAAMCEALNESEFEYKTLKKILSEKEEEVKVLRDECRHLVRLNEQRRQENKLMQSKYAALESKNKELKLNQCTIISGASIALSALYARLNNLVEQLFFSYNISDKDLEDIIFANGAHANSTSSDDTPDCEISAIQESVEEMTLSPQKNQSFIAAVIRAIKNATAPSGKILRPLNVKSSYICKEDESDSTEMLDSETEPCLMMDNVLEDVIIPDSHSHNMVSSIGVVNPQPGLSSDFVSAGDESLQSLSQAITNRQQVELQINITTVNSGSNSSEDPGGRLCEDTSFYESMQENLSNLEYYPTQTLVEEVIEVDNLMTKLLKVLRLIQMENDTCIQQLILDKNKLQQSKEDLIEKLKALEDMNIKLQADLLDATQELIIRNNDLSSAKADIQRHRNEIDRLNEDVCQLSTLCTQSNTHHEVREKEFTLDAILKLIRTWNKQEYFFKADVKSLIADIYFEDIMKSNGNQDLQHKYINVALNEDLIKNICHQSKERSLRVLKNLQGVVHDHSILQQIEDELQGVSNHSILGILALCSSKANLPSSSSQDIVNANN